MFSFHRLVEIASKFSLSGDYFNPGSEFLDVNYIKSWLEEEGEKRGSPGRPVTLWSYDGNFFRNSFSVSIPASMDGLAGKIMEYWTTHGGNPYPCEAVFVVQDKDLHLVRLHSKDVSDRGLHISHEAFNSNPSNDNHFMRKILPEFLAKVQ